MTPVSLSLKATAKAGASIAVTRQNASRDSTFDQTVNTIADTFVKARLASRALDAYPGPLPDSLAAAYLCQARAISLWPDQVGGWKVGSIRSDLASQYGQNRLIGPIFRKAVRRFEAGTCFEFRTFAGGFAAAEPEYVLRIGRDADPGQGQWTVDQAKSLVDTVFQGVEIAGSPFPGINDFGPAVVVSDFGNNDGLLLGAEVMDWQTLPFPQWSSRLYIDGVLAGEGSVDDLVGGPFESLRFALEQVTRMGLSIRRGDLISTGAITGVHRVFAGQRVRAEYGTGPVIECLAL
jgi:2-keto-4-pentenoate hydratase